MEFDLEQVYRLVDVQDHDGRSKVESRALYRDRVGCLAKHLRICPDDDSQIVRMDFVQDANGRWINRHLHTSLVTDITEDGVLKISTMNSVYILERAELAEAEPRDEAELIELYLSSEGMCFCKGFYYDAEKKRHELVCSVHVGMHVDSCLICIADDGLGRIVCRYFPGERGVEFYNTIYNQQNYSTRMLIHNSDTRPLEIRFERFDAVWTIEPDGEKYITPYSFEGSDAARV